MDTNEKLLTLEDLMSRWTVKKNTLYNWVSQGKLQAVKIGGLRFRAEQIKEFEEQHKRS